MQISSKFLRFARFSKNLLNDPINMPLSDLLKMKKKRGKGEKILWNEKNGVNLHPHFRKARLSASPFKRCRRTV